MVCDYFSRLVIQKHGQDLRARPSARSLRVSERNHVHCGTVRRDQRLCGPLGQRTRPGWHHHAKRHAGRIAHNDRRRRQWIIGGGRASGAGTPPPRAGSDSLADVKLPLDVSGAEAARALRRLGFRVQRQTGSRLSCFGDTRIDRCRSSRKF